MLSQLNIKNYTLIEDVELQLQKGFSSITGETGAGKSILLGALSLVLGARADNSIFHNNKEKCIIEAHFNVSNLNLKEIFERLDVDYDINTIFRREIVPSGRTRIFINDSPVSQNVVQLISGYLIDVHSQHHSLEINSSETQLHFLDSYSDTLKMLEEYSMKFNSWKKEIVKLNSLKQFKDTSLKEFDFHQFQLNEISECDIGNLDYSDLIKRFELSNNSQELKEKLEKIDQLFNSNEGVSASLKRVENILNDLSNTNEQFSLFIERIRSVKHELEDIDFELSKISQKLEINPREKERMEQIIDRVRSLLYKHRVDDLEQLEEIRTDLKNKIRAHEDVGPKIQECEKNIDYLKIELEKLAALISKKRKLKAIQFEKKIQNVIGHLKMSNTKLKFDIVQQKELNKFGKDNVEILLSSDNGLSFQALTKSASGGELSRIVLAIKSVLSKKVVLPTIIFDEIDTGVSGEIARKTAEILNEMAENMQVISITHLPQVASLSEHHYKVSKKTLKGKPNTTIDKLSPKERVEEIAKMLSGNIVTDEAYANAKVLLSK